MIIANELKIPHIMNDTKSKQTNRMHPMNRPYEHSHKLTIMHSIEGELID